MKRETLLERKRFAAELAERDALRPQRTARHTPVRAARRDDDGVPSGSPTMPPQKAAQLLPASIEVEKEEVERYRMRRWWLDRYTLDEIRDLAEGLR